MNAEKEMKLALENAEAALASGELVKAKTQLDMASSSKLLAKRVAAAGARYKEDMARAILAKQHAPPKPPEPPKPVEVKPVEPPKAAGASSEVAALLDEAKLLQKDKQFPAARAKLEKCIKLAPKQPDCHKVLGSVWAKQGESDKGAREYREFMKYATPDHPDYEKVKAILESFDRK
jgi:tetratricopeptide (TPR) repeat protein